MVVNVSSCVQGEHLVHAETTVEHNATKLHVAHAGNKAFTPEERVDSGLLTVVWNSSPALQARA